MYDWVIHRTGVSRLQRRYLMTLYHIKRLFSVKFMGLLSLFHDGF